MKRVVAIVFIAASASGCALTPVETTRSSECKIELTGFSDGEFVNVTADKISITLGDHAQLKINNLTSSHLTAKTSGMSRISVSDGNVSDRSVSD